jgi:hypothetical protein
MRLAERPAQRLRAIGDEDEMDVVRHQAIGPDGDALLAALARQEVAIEFVVLVGEKHPLAPIAALRHMMGKARDNKAGDAGHGTLGGRRPRRG